jgi:mono/diheme cytochrome c family protein
MKLITAAFIATFAGAVSFVAIADVPDDKKPYRIENGRVDASTYRGWLVYHSACHTCHGVGAVGTSVAPSLVERLQQISESDFNIRVMTSYRIVIDSESAKADDSTAVREAIAAEVRKRESGELVMPAWQGDPKVRPHLSDLHAYLKARADGALGPGKPRPIDQ